MAEVALQTSNGSVLEAVVPGEFSLGEQQALFRLGLGSEPTERLTPQPTTIADIFASVALGTRFADRYNTADRIWAATEAIQMYMKEKATVDNSLTNPENHTGILDCLDFLHSQTPAKDEFTKLQLLDCHVTIGHTALWKAQMAFAETMLSHTIKQHAPPVLTPEMRTGNTYAAPENNQAASDLLVLAIAMNGLACALQRKDPPPDFFFTEAYLAKHSNRGVIPPALEARLRHYLAAYYAVTNNQSKAQSHKSRALILSGTRPLELGETGSAALSRSTQLQARRRRNERSALAAYNRRKRQPLRS